MSGEMVTFECGGETYEGYLARSVQGSGPGVIVLQEWWGLVDHIKHVCDRFAAAGFTALAPDLYKGESTKDPDDAATLMMALNIAETEKVLRCAVDRLQHDEATNSGKVGVIGFCMGGQLSLYAASTNKSIGACADFYGIHPHVVPPLEQLEAPVLGVFAEHDEYASPSAVAQLDERLTDLGKEHAFKTYAGAHHAFFNNDRPEVYNPEAASDAWNRTVDFFRSTLSA